MILKTHQLTKGTMKLVNEIEFKTSKNLKIEKTISGGSVANLCWSSQLVIKYGKISDDELGQNIQKD